MGVITNLDTLIDDTVATRLDELDATVTTLSFDTDTDTLSYVDEEGTTTDVDLSKYIDDTNLARITSASLDSETGEVTFTRNDDSTFTLDLSSLIDTNIVVTANLTSTSDDEALAASQGKILQDNKVDNNSAQVLSTDDNAMTIDDHTITLKRGDGSTDTVTVPDNDTTYSVGDGGLTEINFTSARRDKLDGIESGAEVNVQPDWATADTDDDSYIKNKPFVAAQVQTATSDVIYGDSETDKNYRLRVINGDIALEEL